MKGNILNFVAENAIPAFRFAKVGTAEGKVKLATAGDLALGVSLDIDSASGARADVQMDGIAKVEAGAAISYGAKVCAGDNGKAVAVVSGDVLGVALDSASAAGDIIRVKLVMGYVAAATQAAANQGSTT